MQPFARVRLNPQHIAVIRCLAWCCCIGRIPAFGSSEQGLQRIAATKGVAQIGQP